MRTSLATSLFTSHLTSTSNSLSSSISMTTVNFMITDWEALVTGLVNPKKDKYFANNGLFISFQLTPLRQEILQNVRKARALDHIGKFKVDSNGRIFASKIKGTPGVKIPLPWKEIFNLDILSTICDGAAMPLVVRKERPVRVRQ